MATQVQNRRGTTAEHSTFTGAVGELTVDTTKDTVVVHDGAVAGGRPLLREDQSNLPTSAPTTGIYNASGSLAISTGGSGRLFVDASGRVGIGVASPATPLHVRATNTSVRATAASTDFTAFEAAVDSGATCRIGAYVGSNGFVGTTTNHPLTFETNSAERLRITAAGLVGVGTSSPSEALTVAGNIRANNTNATIGAYGANSSSPQLVLGNSAGTIHYSIYETIDGSGNRGNLNIFDNIGSANRLTIDTSGRVGIGTTTPSSKLVVEDSAALKIAVLRTATAVVGMGVESGPYVYSDGALQFRVGATAGGSADERARIDTSGRLLVGTSTSTNNSRLGQKLAVVSSGGTANDYGGISLTTYAGSSDSFSAPVLDFQRSRGTADGSFAEVVSGDALGYIAFRGADGAGWSDAASIKCEADGDWTTSGDATDSPGRLVFSTTADGASSPTERMRITQAGVHAMFAATDALSIHSAAASGASTAMIQCRHSATGVFSGTASFFVYTNGNVLNTNNSYGAISDIKLKENIVDANSQWSDIKALQVRKYNFKEGQTHTQIGLVAQEVELVSPGLVSESPDRDAEGNDLGTTTKSVNYSVLYMKAVKALQEAMERIETLEVKVAALESV